MERHGFVVHLALLPRHDGRARQLSEIPAYAAPARAQVEELVGLPPTAVFTYQVDPTRDEGIEYAHSLIKAGVPTELHHYSNAFHVAHSVPGTAVGLRIANERVEAVRRLLQVDE